MTRPNPKVARGGKWLLPASEVAFDFAATAPSPNLGTAHRTDCQVSLVGLISRKTRLFGLQPDISMLSILSANSFSLWAVSK
jgi:hypothetical protein